MPPGVQRGQPAREVTRGQQPRRPRRGCLRPERPRAGCGNHSRGKSQKGGTDVTLFKFGNKVRFTGGLQRQEPEFPQTCHPASPMCASNQDSERNRETAPAAKPFTQPQAVRPSHWFSSGPETHDPTLCVSVCLLRSVTASPSFLIGHDLDDFGELPGKYFVQIHCVCKNLLGGGIGPTRERKLQPVGRIWAPILCGPPARDAFHIFF